MNQQQRKYALERVQAIKNSRLEKLSEAFKATAKTITDEARADLIRKGKVKLDKSVHKIRAYDDVRQVFDFTGFVGHSEKQLAENNAAKAKIESEAASIKDQIMLGDAEEALKLLTDFASAA